MTTTSNMGLIKLSSLVCSVSILSSCGGSGTTDITSLNETSEYSVNVRDHSSGVKVYLGNTSDPDDGTRAFAALVDSQETLEFIYLDSDSMSAHVKNESYYGQIDAGVFYEITAQIGLEEVDSYVYFDLESPETGLVSLVAQGQKQSILAEGAKLNGVPSGAFTYSGGMVVGIKNGVAPQIGSFTMNADFNAGTGTLTGNTATYNIYIPNIEILTQNGQFGSKSVEILNPYTVNIKNYWVGKLDGTFTGDFADGVIGVFSSSDGEIIGGVSGKKG